MRSVSCDEIPAPKLRPVWTVGQIFRSYRVKTVDVRANKLVQKRGRDGKGRGLRREELVGTKKDGQRDPFSGSLWCTFGQWDLSLTESPETLIPSK